MMRRRRIRVLITLSLLVVAEMVLAARPAQAQTRRRDPEKWEFSMYGGWGTLGGQQEFATQVGENGSNVVRLDQGSGWVLGMRITENLKDAFAAEFEYAIQDQPMAALNLSPTLTRLNLDQKLHNFSYNAVIYPLGRRGSVRPFATIGLGASLFQISSDAEAAGIANGLDLVDRWKLAVTVGGGVKFKTGKNWGLRLDVRDHITSVPDWGLPRSAVVTDGVTSAAFRPDGRFHNYQFTAGFIYFFQP